MVHVILMAVLVGAQPLVALADDDCTKAQQFYDQAVKRLNYQERRDLFLQAVELCPSHVKAHVNLADAYENLDDFQNAELHYLEALKLRQDLPVAYTGLGEVYLKTGRYPLAADAFRKGLEISPEDDRPQAGLKVASERLSREKKFYGADTIKACLVTDEEFRLMCMCPGDDYSYLKRWICIPPVLFASGSTSLSTSARRQLDAIGDALQSKELQGKRWLIIGHADSVGTQERNLAYSKGRVQTVRRYLVERWGMAPDSFTAIFFAQNRPRATNSTFEGRAENRRVEIVLDE